jgi:hypothetical protein
MEEAGGKITVGAFRPGLKLLVVQFALLVLLPVLVAAAEAKSLSTCFCNELGKNAPVWRLNLHAKDPNSWQVIDGGARGELTIQRSSGRFELKAGGLRPDTEYALVRYEGNPPFGQVLIRGWSDAHGGFTSTGIWQQWTRKFWLVLAKDLQGRHEDFKPGMTDELQAWHPVEYLFESEEL